MTINKTSVGHDHLTHPKYRSDIDGLRAVAILSVISFHAFPELLPGGFIGVDIFFVISGFLISTIIFENLEAGKFSFGEFYVRRIKRIFPALLLVLSASYAFGWFALLADEYKQLGTHIAAGAGFVSNLVLLGESGYFDNAAETKPLLHLWSLGIEEQFYVVWPLLVWLAWKNKKAVFPLILTVAAASFALNLFEVRQNVTAAFYSPQTRFWELLCGSMLAWALYRRGDGENLGGILRLIRSRPVGMARAASLFGALLLLCGFCLIDSSTIFPGAWAALPVAGAVLLIYAGPAAVINRLVLSNRIFVWFGLVSFPLYLWHWPLLAFARILYGHTPPADARASLMLVAIALAWMTYRFVERPIRFGAGGNFQTAGLVLPMLAVGLVGYWASQSNMLSTGAMKAYERSSQVGWQIPVGSDDQIRWCNEMFPARAHLGATLRNDNFCVMEKNAPPNVLLVGDSGNLSLFPGLGETKGANLLILSASSAAPFYNTRTTEVNDTIRYFNYRLTNQALDYAVSSKNIKVVIMSFLGGPSITSDGNPLKIVDVNDLENHDERQIFSRHMTDTLTKLLASGKRVIYVLPNPDLSFDIKSCLGGYRPISLNTAQEKACAMPRSDYFVGHNGAIYRQWAQDVLRKFPSVQVVDLANSLCDEKTCWAEMDKKILYRDGDHLSVYGSKLVAPVLSKLVERDLQSGG